MPPRSLLADFERDGAALLPERHRHDADAQVRIGGGVEAQPRQILRLRLERQNIRAHAGMRADQQREHPDIGADIDEHEVAALRLGLVDFRKQLGPLGHFEHLRREQHAFLAAIAARVEPHAHAPACDVEAAVALHPHGHDSAQADGSRSPSQLSGMVAVAPMTLASSRPGARSPK